MDKFGRPIYPTVFKKLLRSGQVLESYGYVESPPNSNLFRRKIQGAELFADMRGTADVPIWEDPVPIHYIRFTSKLPDWQKRRIRKQELEALFHLGCPCRLSGHFPRSEPEFHDSGAEIDEKAGVFEWPDGFCRQCGRDFRDEGWFCSKVCEQAYEAARLPECAACRDEIPKFKEIKHHVTYFPERVVLVCPGCHALIHLTSRYPELRPPDGDARKFYGLS